MLKKFVLGCLLCLMATQAMGAQKEFSRFSVDLPDAWQAMGQPMDTAEMMVVIFANPAEQNMLNVTCSPSGGQDLAKVSDMMIKNMAGQGITLKVTEKADNRMVLEGSQAGQDVRLIMNVDPAEKNMCFTTMAGDLKKVEPIAKTMKFKNSNLAPY